MFIEKLYRRFDSRRPRIALIVPYGFGMHGEVAARFTEMNETHYQPFEVNLFYTRGLVGENIYTYLSEVFSDKYDLVITVGQQVTVFTHNFFSERGDAIPHLFIGVNDAVKRGIIKSVESSGNNAVGILYEEYETAKALSFLNLCRPGMRRVLLPVLSAEPLVALKHAFCDSKWRIDEYATASQYWHDQRVACDVVSMDTIDKLVAYARTHLHRYDAAILLEGTAEVGMGVALGALCAEQGTTLFTGSRDLVRSSVAALGYGTHAALLAEAAFSYGARLTFEGIRPSDLPTHRLRNSRIAMVNRDLCSLQGVDPEKAVALSQEWGGEVYCSRENKVADAE